MFYSPKFLKSHILCLNILKTSLMIAHRLSSVQTVDRILVIEHGKVAEQGTHDELLARGGIYKTMWDEYQKSVAWTV